MKILITGGAGFIGTHLCEFLLDRGHHVVSLSTAQHPKQGEPERFKTIAADTSRKGEWQEELKGADAIVNLAGKTIFRRWSDSYKKKMYNSRTETTRNIVDALSQDSPVVLCSASAVGYYGNRGEDIVSEEEPSGGGFLAKVGMDWEEEAFRAREKGIRVATMRFGVVLGKGGGAMAKMLPAFRMFVGGPLGDGKQWFPWIHIDDLLTAVLFIIERKELSGPFNFCSPNPVRNRKLAKTLGSVIGRPAFMPAPKLMIRLAMGEMGTALLDSQRAVPERLLKSGFNFRYPDLETAIRQIVE